MIIAGANTLDANKQAVNAMNVFPVPDGDTGTNMSLTILAAARESEKGDALRVDEVAKKAASGALRGARGNSGVITSQLLRGFSKGLEGLEEAGTKELAAAAEQGVKTAYKAVMKPKEGTILTVARACAEAAVRMAEETEDIEVFLKGVLAYAHEVLAQTPDMLPVLKQAGVVDAGGRGLLHILEGALENLRSGEKQEIVEPGANVQEDFAALASIENESITFGYCTEFFINVHEPDDATVQQLKSYLGTIGDSIVCVCDEEIIKIHVHTDHPGLALEKALTIGSLSGLKIDNMREQHTNKIDFRASEKAEAQVPATPVETVKKDIGFVSVSAGKGLSDIFQNLGVDQVIEGGQTMNPSTEDILNAVDLVNADHVFILPNNKNIILAAEQAAKLAEDKKLYVIPTTSVPQGISAMFCYEEGADAEALAEAMKEAIQTVQTATVTFAVRSTQIGEHEIHEGDILGMLDDKIAVVGSEIAQSTKDLLAEAITEDSEMVSIYYGEDVTEEDAAEISAFVEENYPDCEVELQMGGQPLYYYIISVE
ncbi:DAK2 domain-containing protein [Anaerotignum lactatifermentans]|uniref:DAK2 domain-containing protein n=2 Tax=Anaerotignum lactatifermentans TaxID=160404 RepID=A0ABS2G9U3_9FIRM|nr:DAK2 domain-containing protein [Anaerotignum lactatifermentans]MBM6829351.1 DAK2 domain-containing protein [Anaerotignum lactatifermentans]MBM6877408.1 DAK2 domain-containing protein [Anaerotignum lactatifermentans]MBM6950928.1 DAK2 domain-containing protein [Anaerotignum lactatifermentans]